MTAQPEPRPDRAALIQDIQDRTGIDDAMIEHLVRAFYAAAREDPVIGPVFAAHVADWDVHIPRMCAFWSSVMLMSGTYHGQPMQVHARLPVAGEHFGRWLDLFAATARSVCPPETAVLFVDRAERIAQSLEMGCAVTHGDMRPVPRRKAAA